jgi:hypothetical protein
MTSISINNTSKLKINLIPLFRILAKLIKLIKLINHLINSVKSIILTYLQQVIALNSMKYVKELHQMMMIKNSMIKIYQGVISLVIRVLTI